MQYPQNPAVCQREEDIRALIYCLLAIAILPIVLSIATPFYWDSWPYQNDRELASFSIAVVTIGAWVKVFFVFRRLGHNKHHVEQRTQKVQLDNGSIVDQQVRVYRCSKCGTIQTQERVDV